MALSDTQVKMNVPAVRNMAKTFGNISNVLTQVAKVLEYVTNLLKMTAFIGLVGNVAVVQFIDRIRPQIKKIADQCAELNRDLVAAVAAYERGDQQGATRFY